MKTGGPVVRRELNEIGYLESHPEVCQLYFKFCEKFQSSHYQVAKDFSMNFDGRKAVIGQY
jgi:hypothetical protein